MFEPKKEDNTRLQTEPGGGRKNFLALLSKFDNPTSNNSNNDFKKSANIKQPNKIDKPTLNPSSNSSIKQANLNIRIGTHSLRKTFGYHHYKKFGNLPLLQKIFNHSSSSVTLRYIGLEQDIIDESYNNFYL